MPTYTRPDVYIEEIPSGSRPIEGVETAVAAFVGPANRGPLNEAVRISTFTEYEDTCGPLDSDDDHMGLAAQAFYRNGGKAAYVCRVVAEDGATTNASKAIDGNSVTGALVLTATSPGAWANSYRFRVQRPDPDATVFDLEIGQLNDKQEFDAEELFTSLSLDPQDTRYAPDIVEEGSLVATLALASTVTPSQDGVLQGGQIVAADGAELRTALGSGEKSMSLSINGQPPSLIKFDMESASTGTSAADAAFAGANALTTAIQALGGLFSDITVTRTVASGAVVFTLTKPQPSAADEKSFSISITTSGGALAEALRIDAGAASTLTGTTLNATAFTALYGVIDAATDLTIDFPVTIDGLAVTAKVALATISASKRTTDDAVNARAIAAAVQKAVRAANTSVTRIASFACTYDATAKHFTLTAGDASSRVPGITGFSGDLATRMKLTSGTTSIAGRAITDSTHPIVPLEALGTDDQGVLLEGGEAEDPGSSDYASYFGNVLRKVRDITTVLLPGEYWAEDGSGNASLDEARAHCESMQDRILVIDPPPDYEMTAPGHVEDLGLPTSKFTVLYYPWVSVENPEYDADTNAGAAKTVLASPAAFAAGMFGKIDGKRGVWKAPAGVETNLAGVSGLEFNVENAEQDVLNPLGVNCIRRLPGYGNVIWGARTLATKADPEWRYVPVRRTAIFIEDSIRNAIPWAVFEGNDTPLWLSLKANIGGFMDGLHRSGAFQGDKASDAYFVRCGLGETMTQTDIDAGRVIVMVGFAPLKPAEFVIVRIQQIVNMQ